MRQILLTLLLSLFIFGSVYSQQYDFKPYSVEDGLPRSSVYCLLEDSRGFLWVGSEGGGISRFDGKEFVTYTTEHGLADNTVRCLYEDRDGLIWIGTDGNGISRFDGKTFQSFDSENGLSNDYVRCITQDTVGNIWIGTFGGGINRLHFDGDSLHIAVFNTEGPLTNNAVRTCLTDSKGNLWFGTDNGLCHLNGTDTSDWIYEPFTDQERILVLQEDKQGNIWIGTENGLIKKTRSGFQRLTTDNGLISNRIRAICEDNSGNLWFGTQEGVSSYNGRVFHSFTSDNGLSNDRIRHIIKDRTGSLWFGTHFGGICRFSGEEFIHFTEQDGLPNNQVLSIYSNDSNIWLGTLEGLAELSTSDDGTYNLNPNPLDIDLSDHSINIISKHPSGETWLGTDKGILINSNGKTHWFEGDGLPFDENVKALLFDEDSSVWIGSTQGVTRYAFKNSGYSFDQYHSNPNINESEISGLLTDDKGRIWVGYLRSAPVVFNGEYFELPSLPDGLKNVSCLATDSKGSIWLATRTNGLYRYTASSDSIIESDFVRFGLEDGLSSRDLHQLLIDPRGTIWIGTVSGVDRVDLTRNSDIATVAHFGREEGFFGVETNINASCFDKDGNVWFGTIGGATRYNKATGSKTLVAPTIHITEVHLSFGNELLGMGDFTTGTMGYFGLPKDLELPFEFNDLSISFNAIDLRLPEKVRYQWKLEGFSDEWSVMEEAQTIQLSNVPSGTHEFQVRAIGSSGIWTEVPATFTFVVLPPIYFTWWFITLAILLFAGSIYGIIKLREKRHLAERLKLQQKVDERTSELRQEKERSDELLLNILPLETAEELKKKGYASVQQYDRVSVLFTDFVGFTNITEGITNEELVRSLDEHFRMFDEVMDKYGIEKIKTIGDAYMAAGGIPTRTITNPLSVVAAGLEMIARLEELNKTKQLKGEQAWQLRLGIHTGSVISGVVGKNKFAFDIWGDAVNTAARMESSGEVMKVNISGSTYELIKGHFECTPRGKIKAKNKGEIEMYFVERLKPAFSETASGLIPNETFMAMVSRDGEKISLPN